MYVDFLRLVLEMINTVLVSCLPLNPELVYALLHRQDVLIPLQVNLPFLLDASFARRLPCLIHLPAGRPS